MPFWWKRRKRPWFGRWRYRRNKFRSFRKRRPRRRYARRRTRRTTRRRRKRKVRRKRKKIPIQQWQPESIKKCKIIGFSDLIIGAEGRQFLCWTDEREQYIQPKAPGGGGFGYETITLDYLYSQHRAHNCVWTASNQYKDLCRYTGGCIWLYRHPTTDFVFSYSVQPPFEITKLTYPQLQPQNMLLEPTHKIILSLKNKPHGKHRVKIKFKPPKTMSNTWYFQKQFSDFPLVLFRATAASFSFPRISPLSQSQMITIYYLDTNMWTSCNWAATQNSWWKPAGTATTWEFITKTSAGDVITKVNQTTNWPNSKDGYYQSINKNTGWFQKKILNAYKMKRDNQEVANRPIYTARYNPNEDDGYGNVIYAVSLLQSSWAEPTTQQDYVIRGLPLWMGFYGFYSFLKLITKDKAFDEHYMFIVKCRAIRPISQPTPQSYYPFIDRSFIDSTLPYDEYISANIEKFWYPKAYFQQQTINAFVEAGPFIPKYTNIPYSTWELSYKYIFYFKWGGPQVTDPPVDDPTGKGTYPLPGPHQAAIQISNPKKQSTESMLHEWDWRRGFATQTAIKRMQENIETDTSFQSDDSASPPKRRKVSKKVQRPEDKEEKIKSCLLSLCEEPTYQEETTDIQQLIQQQQHEQRNLKRNILTLLTHLKSNQRFLNLQTGHLQ
ncbi:ORF1 [Anelloviridae sp.]|nr:ORF1 [Anelloviridae sp.]